MIPLISSIYQLGVESAGFRNLFLIKNCTEKKEKKKGTICETLRG